MSKRLVKELTYDAPVEAVFAMLADPAFREDVCKAQGVTKVTATVEDKDDGLHVVVDQMQATKGIPSVAKKLVGDETNIVQTEHWTGPDHGTITVTIPGKPGDMSGTAKIETKGGRTVETVDLTVKVNIPLVGGKIESVIADLLGKALDAEQRVGTKYLAR